MSEEARGRWQRRPPGQGIRARSRKGEIGQTWWSRRFIAMLESFGFGPRLARGRTYARRGQVLDLEVRPGEVRAAVQGSRARPYRVRIAVPALHERDWARVERVMARRALFAARLLAGEMPREIEDAFAASRLSLFPASGRELASSCTCPDWAIPCKHVAAAFYILAEAFDTDPFLIFAWRGRSRDQLIARLRALRGSGPPEAPGADAEPGLAGPPLAENMEGFWEPGPALGDVRIQPGAAASDTLLRQLGPPPPGAGLSELWRLLPSAYAAIAEAAERRALGNGDE